jgi:hypothetical protein
MHSEALTNIPTWVGEYSDVAPLKKLLPSHTRSEGDLSIGVLLTSCKPMTFVGEISAK